MTCILADDEEPARRLLIDYISKSEDLQLKDAFSNGVDALNYLRDSHIDLIFLDVNMPGITGLELLKSIKNPPMAILTTAYSEHAVESFELDVIDYLQKPFPFDRFLKAVIKAREYFHSTTQQVTFDTYFFVKSDYKIVKIEFDDVFFIEGLKEYVRIHTKEKKIITLLALNKLEEKLPQNRFMRVHRSYIINYKHINSYHNNLIEIGQLQIPVGQNYKSKLIEALNKRGIF